ncbi:MAG: PDZ domain-containing protein [Chloroflexota bacterium]|nr:PDZ domain-containing protein [Chloroflexota bacterium]
MQRNPPGLMFVIVGAAILVFAVGLLVSMIRTANEANPVEGTRTLADVVQEDQSIADAATTYASCAPPTVEAPSVADSETTAQPDATFAPAAATVILPESQNRTSDETFVERQAANQIVTNPTPGYLGIVVEDVLNCGARIVEFSSAGAASGSDLQIGDVIVAVNGITISTLTDQAAGVYLEVTDDGNASTNGEPSAAFTPSLALFNQIHQQVPGVDVTLSVQRNDESYAIRVELIAFPVSS